MINIFQFFACRWVLFANNKSASLYEVKSGALLWNIRKNVQLGIVGSGLVFEFVSTFA
jgi:hypothetical protein